MTEWIRPDEYLDELEYRVPMSRMTSEARQRIAYIQAEMEDMSNGKLRSEGNTAGGQHSL